MGRDCYLSQHCRMRRMVVEESTHYRRKTGIIIAEIDLTGGSSFIAPRKKPMQVQALLEKAVASLAVTPVCPRCRKTIPSEDVNVLNDIAYCRACNLSHHLSTLTSGVVLDPDIDLSRLRPEPGFAAIRSAPQMGQHIAHPDRRLDCCCSAFFGTGLFRCSCCWRPPRRCNISASGCLHGFPHLPLTAK